MIAKHNFFTYSDCKITSKRSSVMKFMYFFDDKIKRHIMKGKKEKAYLNRTTYRMKKFGVKLKNCVQIEDGYYAIEDDEVFDIEGINIQAIHTPGHTLGHTCYVVDNKVLFTGDCLAINDNGGYSFLIFYPISRYEQKIIVEIKGTDC